MALVIDKIVEDSLNCKQERPASLESLVFSIDGYQVYDVGYCCSQIDKVILQHDDCQGYETYKANECTANDLAALHVLQKTLKGTLGNQLNGEDIKNSNTTCIYSNLSCTQIGIVEQEEYTSYTEEHEQQISCRTHDTLGSYAHDG